MTMACGLKARVPFLDQDLVELAAACPPEVKTAQSGRETLKDLGRKVLPAQMIDRPKGHFPVPTLIHLEEPIVSMVREALYAREAKNRGDSAPIFWRRCWPTPRPFSGCRPGSGPWPSRRTPRSPGRVDHRAAAGRA